jgi:hypothetical protein
MTVRPLQTGFRCEAGGAASAGAIENAQSAAIIIAENVFKIK